MSTSPAIGTTRTVFSAAAMVVSSALPVALVAAFAVRIEETLSISDAQIGAAISVYFGVSVVFAMSGGRLADRLGPMRALITAAGLTSVALVGAGLVARSYPVLLVFLAIAGIGQALAAPTSNVMLAAGVRAARIGTAMGFKQASVPLAAFLAGLAVAVTATDLSWRWPFVLAVAVPAVAVANALSVRIPRVATTNSGSARALRLTHMWRFPFAGGLSTFSASAITGFVVLGLVDAGFSEAVSGLVLTIAGFGSLAVRVGSGILKDRFGYRAVHAVMALLLVGTVGFGLMVSGLRPLVPVGAVVAFGAGWGWPAMFQLALVERFGDAPGAATGIARLGLAGGNALGPLVFGIVFQTVGYRTGWAIAGVCMVGAVAAVRSAARST